MRTSLYTVLSCTLPRTGIYYSHETVGTLDSVSNNMEDKFKTMSSILEKRQLGHLIEVFLEEKITPDLISQLSAYELN